MRTASLGRKPMDIYLLECVFFIVAMSGIALTLITFFLERKEITTKTDRKKEGQADIIQNLASSRLEK